MTATPVNRFVPRVSALCLLFTVAGGQAVWAQGFGPDPFRPYNNQYDAFVYPLGSADAAAAAAMRSGVRGANQFQNYLDEMQGLGRSGVERYGQGLPYYRRAIDPRFDPKQERDYRPNHRTDESFEETQRRLTDKYLAYFEERGDPKKRAQLLREYQKYRRQATQALTARRISPSRFAESVNRPEPGEADRSSASGSERRSGNSSARSPAPAAGAARLRPSEPTTRTAPRSAPPPPLSSRSGTPSSLRRSPSDVLDRARRMERANPRGTGRLSRGSATDRTGDSSRLPLDRSTPND